jgi:hypothetical protein
MKVMMLMIANPHAAPSAPPTEEALLAMHEYNEELEKAGVLLDLGGLTPPAQGVRIHYSGSKRTVVDGPFPESKEMIAGYSVLEVKDLAEAIEWAKRSPFMGSDATVEIRPLFDPSQFDTPGEAEERAKKQAAKSGAAAR